MANSQAALMTPTDRRRFRPCHTTIRPNDNPVRSSGRLRLPSASQERQANETLKDAEHTPRERTRTSLSARHFPDPSE